METDEQDDESSQDQELPSENENSQSEDSVGGDNDFENGLSTADTCKGPPLMGHKKRLFTFQFNNLGNTDINYIKDDTRHIRFDDRQPRLDGKSCPTGWATFDFGTFFCLHLNRRAFQSLHVLFDLFVFPTVNSFTVMYFYCN